MMSRIIGVPYQVGVKLDMVDAALASLPLIAPDILQRWKTLKERTRRQSVLRNAVAHGTTWGGVGDKDLSLSGAFFTARERKIYNTG